MFRRALLAGIFGVATFVVTGPTQVEAQATCGDTDATSATCSLTAGAVTVTAEVDHIVYLSLSNENASLSAPTDADFTVDGDVQLEDLALQTLTVRSNADWDVTIQGAAWTAPYAKPVGDIEWTVDGGTSWTAMTTSPVALDAGTPTAGDDIEIGYRTLWELADDEAGTYEMELSLAITAP